MKRIFNENKAITLVALVITIVLLLVLAGISIQALTNQGLFAQAQKAKNLTEEKTAEENEILTNYLEQMNAIIGGQVTESIPDGAVVTPINAITTWLKTAGISKQYSYTTIEQVITDSTCTESLMNNENAMKYLARSTEFKDAICASETAMRYLGESIYVDDTVLNSDEWVNAIFNSSYMQSVLLPLVPIMTSNTQPSGKCTNSAQDGNTSQYPYYVFDNDPYTMWASGYATDKFVAYEFPSPKKVLAFSIGNANQQDAGRHGRESWGQGKIQASNDGINWIDLCSIKYTQKPGIPAAVQSFMLDDESAHDKYLHFRFYSTGNNADGNNSWIAINELQFYGR